MALDKEEKWINEMMAQGKELCAFGIGRYDFVEGTPGEYIYRAELLAKSAKHAESRKYIQFIEDTGAEYLGNCTLKVYFRRKAEYGRFDIYSGIDSQIKYLNRLIIFFSILTSAGFLAGTPYIIASQVYNESMFLFAGIMNIAAGLAVSIGLVTVISKKRRLKKEKTLRE